MSGQARLRARVKEVIVRALGLQVQPEELADEEALFGADTGPDPVGAVAIVCALEAEFGIEVEDHELGEEAFDSVCALAGLVQGKLRDKGGSRPLPIHA